LLRHAQTPYDMHAVEAPPQRHGLTLGATRELLLPATLIGCFALQYWGQQPFAVVVVCALPMLALYAAAPAWAARSIARFDRDSVRLLAAGATQQLRVRYRRAVGMRLFAPPALRAERKAMVLLECGDARGARAAYAEVLEELGALAPPRVVLGHAHASFATGDDATAIGMYRRVLGSVGALPGVERKLAHALIRKGEDLDEALALLSRTQREAAEGEPKQAHTLLHALALAKLGERESARALLEQVVVPAESLLALHAEVVRTIEGAVAPRV
jgi:tetratricopeptide (TPR) repeat protein